MSDVCKQKRLMQNISLSTKSKFFYFISSGYSVLNCTKEVIKALFSDYPFCYLDYYNQSTDCHELALEVEIGEMTLQCCFDEAEKCDACYVFFDNIDEVNAYIELCNEMLEYCPITKKWKLGSYFILYLEEEGDRFFGFFANRI